MVKSTSYCKPELWGGIECTINRIGDQFQDQLALTGHYGRKDDIALFSELGISSFRFPILWEKHEPVQGVEIDWSWAEQQLESLSQHNIKPIAGLLHHGSGPAFTDLSDKNFPDYFADYALKVARRFPSIEYYTPINEPLTTARFSGLYGHWYPHEKTGLSFARILINQLRGIVLAMKAIRSINPDAKLVQTEDLGKTYSSPRLRYQANFENIRRWLTYDLLCGKVNRSHRLWNYFRWLGIRKKELDFFISNPCKPDIIGVNHYVTSERFLDDEIHEYPPHMIGSNKRHRYADVEAVRIRHEQPFGLNILLKEVWDRYKLPIAITEVQLHCHRDDQLRWFKQVWSTACESLNEGIDIRAVTPWSLLGAYGWNKLLTLPVGEYEPGVFDVTNSVPRRTALFTLIQSINENAEEKFPFINEPGWWQREIRFLKKSQRIIPEMSYSERNTSRPVLIIGKRGTLGKAFARICEARAINYKLVGREDVDITNEKQIGDIIDKIKPWGVINAAGFVRVDEAEKEFEQCFLANTQGPSTLARICKIHGIRFLTFSSDLVFDGGKENPYTESDLANPLSIYGRSKAESEKAVLNNYPDSLVIRTSAFFGPWDRYNFATNVLDTIERNEQFAATDDITISPTYVPDLVNSSLDLLIDEEKDIWHLTNNGSVTWYELARDIADRAGKPADSIIRQSMQEMGFVAPRPIYSVLRSEKGMRLPSLETALESFFKHAPKALKELQHSPAA